MLRLQTRKGLSLAVGLGFGLGLMAGAVVLAVVLQPAPTDEEIRARARTLGMVSTTELPAPVTAPAKVQKVASIVVTDGANYGDVAAMLKEAGVIADPEALLARAREREVLTRLKVGVHVIPFGDAAKPVSLDQVIDLLTQK